MVKWIAMMVAGLVGVAGVAMAEVGNEVLGPGLPVELVQQEDVVMLSVGDVDVRELERLGNMLAALGDEGPKVEARALNRVGDMARVEVVRTIAKETSLPQKNVRDSLQVKRASASDPVYVISAKGRDVSLRLFKARETLRGVTATVRGQRQLFERSFIKGGSFAKGRVALNMGGNVFERDGARTNLVRVRSGVVIPAEMVDGPAAKAFDQSVARNLPQRLSHEISRVLPG